MIDTFLWIYLLSAIIIMIDALSELYTNDSPEQYLLVLIVGLSVIPLVNTLMALDIIIDKIKEMMK